MRQARLLAITSRTQASCKIRSPTWTSLAVHQSRSCSCSAPLARSVAGSPNNASQRFGIKRGNAIEDKVVDHREIGTALSLFTNHISSPGAPFFQPDGTHILQKLVSFLRAQYPHFGFNEVLTPTIYKKALWEQSGHWANYMDDMFTVTGKPAKTPDHQIGEVSQDFKEREEYGLKPMNCPGHCLLFQAERRSYRDLPIRYAEFSPLHRNEISGALSGLTRVRRFHQDDGHIFCRPSQVKKEIEECLNFIRLVYETMKLPNYRLVLSTRPKTGHIGTVAEWDRAEGQLKAALDENFGEAWKIEEGEGAFYGPKIDVILRDGHGKEHQTGTVQLDFQLPKRFELVYESPAPEMEAIGEDWKDSVSRMILGRTTPVMIHRAILGSLERFMALLLEYRRGQLPFWLNPKQIVILTVTDNQDIKAYAQKAKRWLLGDEAGHCTIRQHTRPEFTPERLQPPDCLIDIDDSAETVAQKIVRARKKKYNIICVVGQRNVTGAETGHGDTVDLDFSAQPDQEEVWRLIEEVKPGSWAAVQKGDGVGTSSSISPRVRLSLFQCRQLIVSLNENYY